MSDLNILTATTKEQAQAAMEYCVNLVTITRVTQNQPTLVAFDNLMQMLVTREEYREIQKLCGKED